MKTGKERGVLVGIQPVVDMISLALQSVFVENEANGFSLILVGNPETAKTSSIFKFQSLDFVSYYDEITQKKLIDEFLPLVKNSQKNTLLVPDLINCIEKQKATRDQFLSIVKSGIDDTGVVAISTAYKQLHYMGLAEGLKFNLITAITKDNFFKIGKFLKETGLASRFLIFTYDYPIVLLKRIFEYIEGKPVMSNVSIPKVRKNRKNIRFDPDMFSQFEFISGRMSEKYGGYGIRPQINLQRMAKSNALMNGRDRVIQEDLDKVIYLSNWLNMDFNSIQDGKKL